MGADNMRKLMETAEQLTEKIRKVPRSRVAWGEDGYPTVRGIDAVWWMADSDDFSDRTFDMIADSVAPHGLHVYVIYDTDADYYWFAVEK